MRATQRAATCRENGVCAPPVALSVCHQRQASVVRVGRGYRARRERQRVAPNKKARRVAAAVCAGRWMNTVRRHVGCRKIGERQHIHKRQENVSKIVFIPSGKKVHECPSCAYPSPLTANPVGSVPS